MGIGGLDKEFSAIFRRAFASRVFPPEIVEQLGKQAMCSFKNWLCELGDKSPLCVLAVCSFESWLSGLGDKSPLCVYACVPVIGCVN